MIVAAVIDCQYRQILDVHCISCRLIRSTMGTLAQKMTTVDSPREHESLDCKTCQLSRYCFKSTRLRRICLLKVKTETLLALKCLAHRLRANAS